MSYAEWKRLAAYKWHEQGELCGACGESLDFRQIVELAHRIPDTKPNRKKYGSKVLKHPINLVLVCTRRGKACNDAVLLGAAQPVAVAELVAEITAEIMGGRDR